MQAEIAASGFGARPRELPWAPALVVALGLVAWGFVLRLPLTGADAWPLLEQASRALRDPGLLLRERYLEGMPIGGSFWRPLYVAVFSLQWSVFGERPMPYHVVRLAAYLATALLAGALARRRGASPRLAWTAAGAMVLLHPLQADMVPSVARSADVLNDLLLVATILCLGRERPRTAHLAAGTALALLAPGVKETGLAAPLIGLLLLEPWSARAGRGRRVAAAILVVGLGLHALARFAILGSLGSYTGLPDREAGLASNAALLAEALTDQRVTWAAVPVLALLVAVAVLGSRGRAALAPPSREWRLVRRGCWAWLVVAAFGALSSPRLADRHAAALLVPAAVLLGASLGGLIGRSNATSSRPAAPWAACGVLVVGLLVVLAPRSPLWRSWPQWGLIGRTSELVIEAADASLGELAASGRPAEVRFGVFRVVAGEQDGRLVVAITPFPYFAAPPSGLRAASLHQPVVLMTYSVRAALRLRGHARPLQVLPGQGVLVTPEHLGPPSTPGPATLGR